MIFLFYEYYKTHGTWIMISIFLVGLIPKGLILYLTELKIVDVLGLNFVYFAYQIGKIPSTIISIKGNIRWVILALEILQILFCLFYLEILEYNFCSLNKNTKKILQKESIDSQLMKIILMKMMKI